MMWQKVNRQTLSCVKFCEGLCFLTLRAALHTIRGKHMSFKIYVAGYLRKSGVPLSGEYPQKLEILSSFKILNACIILALKLNINTQQWHAEV